MHKYMDLSMEFSDTAPYVLIGIAGLIILISSTAFSCIIKGQPVLLYIVSLFSIMLTNEQSSGRADNILGAN